MNFSRPEYGIVVAIGFLAVVFFLIGRISGWASLANVYRTTGEFLGPMWKFQSGQLRWRMGYNNCLTLGANESGLYLSVIFLFRIGHPSLFIPWGDITVSIRKGFLGNHMEFRFKQVQNVPLRVSIPLGEKLLKESGPYGPHIESGGKKNR